MSDVDPNAWMISFSDLLTLLLTFFVLIFTMSSSDDKAVNQAFGFFNAAYGPLEMGTSAAPYPPSSLNQLKKLSTTAVILPGTLINEAFGDALAFGKPKVRMGRIGKYQAARKLREAIKEVGYSLSEIQVRMEGNNLLVRLGERFLFDSGRAVLKPESLPLLERIGKVIKKTPYDIRIEGHTDEIPIHTNVYPSNWELSVARAVNVLHYLVKVDGISPNRLSAAGYGASRPISKRNTPEARALNRRVEIVLIGKSKGDVAYGR